MDSSVPAKSLDDLIQEMPPERLARLESFLLQAVEANPSRLDEATWVLELFAALRQARLSHPGLQCPACAFVPSVVPQVKAAMERFTPADWKVTSEAEWKVVTDRTAPPLASRRALIVSVLERVFSTHSHK